MHAFVLAIGIGCTLSVALVILSFSNEVTKVCLISVIFSSFTDWFTQPVKALFSVCVLASVALQRSKKKRTSPNLKGRVERLAGAIGWLTLPGDMEVGGTNRSARTNNQTEQQQLGAPAVDNWVNEAGTNTGRHKKGAFGGRKKGGPNRPTKTLKSTKPIIDAPTVERPTAQISSETKVEERRAKATKLFTQLAEKREKEKKMQNELLKRASKREVVRRSHDEEVEDELRDASPVQSTPAYVLPKLGSRTDSEKGMHAVMSAGQAGKAGKASPKKTWHTANLAAESFGDLPQRKATVRKKAAAAGKQASYARPWGATKMKPEQSSSSAAQPPRGGKRAGGRR